MTIIKVIYFNRVLTFELIENKMFTYVFYHMESETRKVESCFKTINEIKSFYHDAKIEIKEIK